MSLNPLTAAAMISISDDFLNHAEKQKILAKDPMLLPVADRLKDVHRTLIVLTRKEGESERELKVVSANIQLCNQRHDALCRGLDGALTFAEHMCESAEAAKPIVEARDLLFPQGMGIISASYRDQAGHALSLGERVTPEVRDTLGRVHFDGEDLNAFLERYINVGREMSGLIARRAELQGEDDQTRVSASDLREARYQWQRVVTALLRLLEISRLSETDKRRLLTNLNEAVAQAAARRTRVASGNATQEEIADDNAVEDGAESPQLEADAPEAEIRRQEAPKPVADLEPAGDMN
ncbi:hypothetical protein EA187_08120 [Lujinxingia sediminis]|uniref:Chemotaxis protein CheZ n=1 Tax=Lujinxingia sediminis TaxID=2480984 RepID=A0ABY0CTS1_9DELT|nr:hypothetical protein [Lujinxingia sediminis]RVU45723.1 hypothetical protein EA187_08120 [Lujinxingia sediminis]